MQEIPQHQISPQTSENTAGRGWLEKTLAKLFRASRNGNVSIGSGNKVEGGSSSNNTQIGVDNVISVDNLNPRGPVVVKGNFQAGRGNKIEIH